MDFNEYPPDLVRAVGLVVMSAAWVEDKAGELISLHHGTHETGEAHRSWAASGKQLIEALSTCAPVETVDDLRRALEFRNEVVHGVFLGGPAARAMGWDADWVTLKRWMKRDAPATYAFIPWNVQNLHGLADEFTRLERALDDEISAFMGLTPADPEPT